MGHGATGAGSACLADLAVVCRRGEVRESRWIWRDLWLVMPLTVGPALRAIGWTPDPETPLEALLVSTAVVALAEIGDKTQLLALVLAARFRKPFPILAGILAATLANHAAAGWVGVWLSDQLSPGMLGWILGLSFLAIAAWTLLPDRLEDGDQPGGRHGAFMSTLVAFFLVEIGDKTQVATVALALKYSQLAAVVAGTTFGMLLANAPAVWLGSAAARRIPLRAVRYAAGAVFAGLGIATLARVALA